MKEPIVRTKNGAVRGRHEHRVEAFKGIPFAAPPVGELRFLAPVMPRAWDGVREAADFSPTPPQDQSSEGIPGLSLVPLGGTGWCKGEDYLTMNVWTPDSGARGLPVMVFIYGGAFVAGSSSNPLYNGSRFARDGVVLVSFNYRLGIEGFLPLDGGETNLGIRDQIAALTWVQDNIAAFGGDPGNVTLFGQSAGALSVNTLLAVPTANQLFHRAISQSGGAQHTLSLEQAALIATRVGEILGVKPTRESFAAFSPEQFIEAQSLIQSNSLNLTTARDMDPTGGLVLFLPVRDGDLLSDQPVDAVRTGASANIDLLIGTNSHEMNLNHFLDGILDALTDEQLQDRLRDYHPDPDKIITMYREGRPSALPGELFAAIITDWMFTVPSLRLAEAHAPYSGGTYLYEFAWPSPTCNGRLGACHALELGFVFDTLDTPELTGLSGLVGENPPIELARQMHHTWIAFATHGDPGWIPYNTSPCPVMHMHTDWKLLFDPRRNEREVWNGIR
jgi:para-nitrobenzyl esterase